MLDRFDGKLEFSGLAFQPFNTLVLSDLTLLDDAPIQMEGKARVDTVFCAEKLTARFGLAGLLSKNGIRINSVELYNACMTLTAEPGETYKSNIARIFHLVKKQKEKSGKDVFSIRKASLEDFRFRLVSFKPAKKEYSGYGLDWTDLDLHADIIARNIKFSNSIMTGTAERISLSEKSGYLANNISGKARVGRGRTQITDLHIQDAWSDALVPEFTMEYAENSKPFKNLKDKVRMHGEIGKGTLSFQTLSYFVPTFKDNGIVADISSASIDGYLNDLSINGLKFSDRTSGIECSASAAMTGLPDMNELNLDATVNGFKFTVKGLGTFLSQWTKDRKMDFGTLARNEEFTFSGSASGSLSDLKVDGDVVSGIGSAAASLGIKGLAGGGTPEIAGNVSTKDLDIGRIIGKDFIHEATIGTNLKAVLSKGSPSLTIDSVRVSRLNLKGYDYSGIVAEGKYADQSFDGHIRCDDPNIKFSFDGLLSLGKDIENALYRFKASIGYADLHALNFDSREVSKVSASDISADYTRVAKGDLSGIAEASGIVLENAGGKYDIGTIRLNSRSADRDNEINLSSAIADGSFKGTGSIGTFVKDILSLTSEKELPALFGEPEEGRTANAYSVNLNILDSRNLLAFFAPGAYLADSTAVRMSITEEGAIKARVSSQRIAFKEKYLKDLSIDLNNDDSALNCNLKSGELRLTPSIVLKNNSLVLYANDNAIGLGYNFDNATSVENRGEFYLTGNVAESEPGSPVINASTLTSNISINGENWDLQPAEFRYSKDGLKMQGVRISNGDQVASADGGVSKSLSDSLVLNLNNINLSHLNGLIARSPDISGLTSGSILVTSPLEGNFGLEANVVSEGTSIAGHEAGTVIAGCSMNGGGDRLDFALRNSLDGSSSFGTQGFYSISDKSLDLTASLDGFDFGYAAPFLESVFSGLEGRISGSISANGPLNKLNVRSEGLDLRDGMIRVAFTNVPYYVEGPLHLDNNGLYFDNLDVKDRYNGSGNVSGGIAFDRFKDIRMNTRIRLDNIECLNTSAADNSSFYGRVFGTGRMNINGPFNALDLDIEATTTKEGSFHIPLSGASAYGGNDLLVFVEPENFEEIDPYDLMMNTIGGAKKVQSQMGIRLKVNATPGVEASLEIDKASGNVLTGRGAGTISLDVRPSAGAFNINGDYTLSSGNYHFSALGIANKDFSILDGSTIKFNGDIMDSDLNIEAQYNTKTSLSSLIADTTSVSTRRNVECGISITDKLRNPQLSFSINVPDLDPTTKSRVESALSTDDKVQKQFIALLVTNNFIPDDQSGIVNNSNILYSNVADIMANQLNNILQKLDIPLDLGLKYQENGSGSSIFDVALSTQLFNNRVSVNGNIGNRQYMKSGNEDVVGDLDIEIKMDRDGKVRLNLFSHSADAYTNYLDDSQRNGIGVAYQKEFNSIRRFIRSIFMPKSERQAMELEESSRDEERVIINIEK